jgi:hypothetical protein
MTTEDKAFTQITPQATENTAATVNYLTFTQALDLLEATRCRYQQLREKRMAYEATDD